MRTRAIPCLPFPLNPNCFPSPYRCWPRLREDSRRRARRQESQEGRLLVGGPHQGRLRPWQQVDGQIPWPGRPQRLSDIPHEQWIVAEACGRHPAAETTFSLDATAETALEPGCGATRRATCAGTPCDARDVSTEPSRRYTSYQRIERPSEWRVRSVERFCVSARRGRCGCAWAARPRTNGPIPACIYRAAQSMLTAARRSTRAVTRWPLQPHPTALEDQYWFSRAGGCVAVVVALSMSGGADRKRSCFCLYGWY